MKFLVAFGITFLIVTQIDCLETGNFLVYANFSHLSSAVSEVINEVLVKRSTIVNMMWARNSNIEDEMRQEILSQCVRSVKVSLRIESLNSIRIISHRPRRAVVMIARTLEDVKNMISKLTPEVFRYSGLLLVVLDKRIREVDEIFKATWSLGILNVNVMYEAEGSVFVETFFPFKPEVCNSTSAEVINEFKDGKFSHGIEKFFPDKLNNLHQCPLRAASSNTSKPYIFATPTPDGSYKLSGGAIALAEALASSINSQLIFTYVGPQGFVFDNGSMKGVLQALYDDEADLAVHDWFVKLNRLKFFDATVSYMSESIIFVVPPGFPLSSVEKLIFPFTVNLWLAIVALIAVGVLVILAVDKRNNSIKSLVFGRGVKSPIMNMLAGLVGGSQPVLPTNFFSRFILIIFLLSALVLRTAYQASYFNILKSNKHHKEIETVDEIAKRNYTVYLIDGNEDFFDSYDALKTR